MLWKIWFWEFPGNFMPFSQILKASVRNLEAPESRHFPRQPWLRPPRQPPSLLQQSPLRLTGRLRVDLGAMCNSSGPECYRGDANRSKALQRERYFPSGEAGMILEQVVWPFFQLCQRLRKALQRRPQWARQAGENTVHIWKWWAVPLGGHPVLWRADKTPGHGLDFLVTKAELNSVAKGKCRTRQVLTLVGRMLVTTEKASETHGGLPKQQWGKLKVRNLISRPFKTLHSVHWTPQHTGSLPLGLGTVCSFHRGHFAPFLNWPTLPHPSSLSLYITSSDKPLVGHGPEVPGFSQALLFHTSATAVYLLHLFIQGCAISLLACFTPVCITLYSTHCYEALHYIPPPSHLTLFTIVL